MKKQKVKCSLHGFEKIPNVDGYYINRQGDIFSEFQGNILKPFKRGNYKSVRLQQGDKAKNYLLHRLVAQAFIRTPTTCPK